MTRPERHLHAVKDEPTAEVVELFAADVRVPGSDTAATQLNQMFTAFGLDGAS